jgi:hypothetical protein
MTSKTPKSSKIPFLRLGTAIIPKPVDKSIMQSSMNFTLKSIAFVFTLKIVIPRIDWTATYCKFKTIILIASSTDNKLYDCRE